MCILHYEVSNNNMNHRKKCVTKLYFIIVGCVLSLVWFFFRVRCAQLFANKFCVAVGHSLPAVAIAISIQPTRSPIPRPFWAIDWLFFSQLLLHRLVHTLHSYFFCGICLSWFSCWASKAAFSCYVGIGFTEMSDKNWRIGCTLLAIELFGWFWWKSTLLGAQRQASLNILSFSLSLCVQFDDCLAWLAS